MLNTKIEDQHFWYPHPLIILTISESATIHAYTQEKFDQMLKLNTVSPIQPNREIELN